MIYTKKYKFSVFGDFDRIQPTPEILNALLQKYGENGFIPSLANELRVNPDNPQQTMTFQRVILLNTKNKESIAILENRIDYEFQYDHDYVLDDMRINELIDKINNVISYLFDKFDVNSNRIAVNIDCYVIPKEEDYMTILEKFQTPINFINKSEYIDYSVRTLIRKDTNLSNVRETCNIISNITLGDFNKAENESVKHFRGFLVHSDINTIGENITYRFDSNAISPFITRAYKWWQSSMKGLY